MSAPGAGVPCPASSVCCSKENTPDACQRTRSPSSVTPRPTPRPGSGSEPMSPASHASVPGRQRVSSRSDVSGLVSGASTSAGACAGAGSAGTPGSTSTPRRARSIASTITTLSASSSRAQSLASSTRSLGSRIGALAQAQARRIARRASFDRHRGGERGRGGQRRAERPLDAEGEVVVLIARGGPTQRELGGAGGGCHPEDERGRSHQQSEYGPQRFLFTAARLASTRDPRLSRRTASWPSSGPALDSPQPSVASYLCGTAMLSSSSSKFRR
jgi:hypothetical protein